MPIGIILAVLVVLVVVAYVKREQPWAKPVLVLCVVAICGVVVLRAVGGRRGISGDGTKSHATLVEAARLLGESLRGKLDSGARVLVLNEQVGGMGPSSPRIRAALDMGFSPGLGDTSWQLVGFAGPAPGTAEDLSEAIDATRVGFDVVISVSGLPDDLDELSIYQDDPPPLVAAYFPRGAESELVRMWLIDGLIAVAVVADEGLLDVYTPGQLP